MPNKRIICLLFMFLGTFYLTLFSSHSEKIVPNKPFTAFPLQIGEWNGTVGSLDDRVYNMLGVEDYTLANYINFQKDKINLYVGFYQSQSEGDIIHSPKHCMPGSGWKITETSTERVQVDSSEKQIKIIKLVLKKNAEKQIVYYWFQSRGRIISSEYTQKIYLVIDSIVKHRTDGSFVRLVSPVIKDEERTIRQLKAFIRKLYPILKEFIPE